MKKILLMILAFFPAWIYSQQFFPADYVNPFIGTGGHGHTYPGAVVPFGMMQLSPDTRLDGWDGCSGYHASDSVIYGFSHTHLSGTGCLDYGDILLMPVTGPFYFDNKDYSSGFDHSKEVAEAGYYKTELAKYGITAELTASKRVGMHRYSFPASDSAGILLDLSHRDKVIESSIKIISDTEVEGKRVSAEWAENQIIYFVIKFSKPFDSYILNDSNPAANQKGIKTRVSFKTLKNSKIIVKVGISAVSTDGARKNMETEIPGWDFDIVRDKARNEWNRELGKIEVSGGTDDQKKAFYTALYHCMLAPNIYSDVDGSYIGRDFLVHKTEGFDYYTVFSLWDTFRAEHPLFTIIDQKRTSHFINTFIKQYEQGGLLPVWELSSNETYCMIGYHAVPVITDAYIKGIGGFDSEKALEAMKNSANQDHSGLEFYKRYGFVPAEQEGESVSKTLEYAYDDWCISQMAKKLGKDEDYSTFIKRGQYYRNVFDPSTGFMRAKMYNCWFSPFNPSEVNFNYTEANSWQYSFFVPQDVSGLMDLDGGKEKFAMKLDALFSADTKTSGRDQADITGLIGQYAHGNEPSHHMIYLYNYVSQPWKTQMLVHSVCANFYKNAPDGLIGNEDCGQMSAWFVLSAMGFYPVTPGSDIYAIGTPLFPQVTINLENGNKFLIKAENLSNENYYITSALLDGKPYNKSFLKHEDIMKGGTLQFVMSSAPGTWGTGEDNYPVSAIKDNLITPVPAFTNKTRTFTDNLTITMNDAFGDAVIHYTTDGTTPSVNSPVYKAPFTTDSTVTVRAFAVKPGYSPSFVVSTDFIKLPENWQIRNSTSWAPQYSAGGERALIDCVRGTKNFRTGTWQGYEGTGIDATIDLGAIRHIGTVCAGFLQDQQSWIFMPVQVEYYISADGKKFKKAGVIINDIPAESKEIALKDFTLKVDKKARYIRVVAVNRGICPPWHPGAGNKAWIFADEITVGK